MAVTPGALDTSSLPTTLPIFPLAGVLLLPHGRLPLNIFEPRYLAMTIDALATPDRLIGMIQPTEEERAGQTQRVYPTGCAGRITSFAETDDGRYQITLAGIARFNVADERPVHPRGYRVVAADFGPWLDDLKTPPESSGIDRPRLLASLKAYFALNKITVDWKVVQQTPDERLITTLAMSCPFEPSEKQALLEAPDVAERARVMIALIEMAALGHGVAEGAKH
jgi:Lon protease-like protein